MTKLTSDPIGKGGIAKFGERLRKGEISAESATSAYLSRIEALDFKLGAFQHVAAEQALATARAMDALLASGTDLGPLMGVPVALKDLFAVEGMPATAGSKVDVSDLIGSEGSFVRALRQAGCVILGKTKTVEFAFGVTGISAPRGTPCNPWGSDVHRLPGGSSSGSAVAVAVGLCAFAIGSDTGGSVRIPAALNGIFGLKTTSGLWPTDGVFPLGRDLDTIGPITKSAADAAVVFGVLTDTPAPQPAPLGGLRLGKPESYFFRNLDPEVEKCTVAAMAALQEEGVEIVPIEVPEAPEREGYFPVALGACLIAVLGRDRFIEHRDKMDPTVASRGDKGLEVLAADFVRLERRREECREIAKTRMEGLDGWISPTATILAPSMADFDDLDFAMRMTLGMTQNTQPANHMGQCATTTPIHGLGASLPVGLQVICAAGQDAMAVSIGRAFENLFGPAPQPDLESFL